MFKFIVGVTGLIASFAWGASANQESPVITLGGSLDTQFGYVTQKYPFNSININSSDPLLPEVFEKTDKYGIVNDTKIDLKIDGRAHCFKYGGLIRLNTDTSTSKEDENSVAYQTMVYIESNLGRLEAGSYLGSYDIMKVNGAYISRATGGIDGDWSYWANTDVDGPLNFFSGAGINTLIIAPRLPTAFDASYEANASKITYYTPLFAGFKIGITYIPDTDQHGTVSNLKGLPASYIINPSSYNQTLAFRNVFQGGISYEGKFDKVDFKFSALGEIGSAKTIALPAIPALVARHDLRAYEVGACVSYADFSLAGSYGSWGKTGLIKVVTVPSTITPVQGARSSEYWTVGISYARDSYGLSFGYMKAANGGFIGQSAGDPVISTLKGKASLFSFGVDYKIAPGFMPYAEITKFMLQDRSTPGDKNSGTVFLAGSKLEF